MSACSRSLRRRRAGTLLLMTLSGTACQAWHTERVAPQTVLATRQPAKLRVTRTDGSQIVLQHPVLRGDTLVGTRPGRQEVRVAYTEAEQVGREVRIPLTEVRQTATRGFSVGRTVGLLVGVAAAVLAAYVAAWASVPRT